MSANHRKCSFPLTLRTYRRIIACHYFSFPLLNVTLTQQLCSRPHFPFGVPSCLEVEPHTWDPVFFLQSSLGQNTTFTCKTTDTSDSYIHVDRQSEWFHETDLRQPDYLSQCKLPGKDRRSKCLTVLNDDYIMISPELITESSWCMRSLYCRLADWLSLSIL